MILTGCGGGSSTTSSSGSGTSSGSSSTNPKPSVISISPSSVVAGSATETLTVTGTGFIASSVVNFNGTALATTYVSATSLTASVPASLLAADGSASISVTNPTPGGGTSTVQSYTITVPTPSVASISPSSITAGTAVTVTVTGSGFEANSQVLWNGTAHPTTYVNNSTLQVALTAADTANGGIGNISVANPGIDPTTPVGLSILATTPVITGLSPNSVTVGSAAQTIYLSGTNFEGNATVQANGQSLTITSQSSTSVSATLPASLIAKVGTVGFVVTNPGSPTITSNTVTMTVAAANTTGTMSVSPSLVPAGSPDTTITVTDYSGNFYQDSIVTFNGAALATTYVNQEQLTAVVPATDLAGFVSATIGVVSSESTTAPATQPFDTYLALQTNDIVYRATDGYIYASVPGAMGQGLGNSVVAIDPTTGVIEKTIFVGSNPNRMALSTDGTQLFVGLDGAGSFVQVNLTTGSVGTPVLLGGGPGVYNPPYTALSFAPVPGSANSVAVYATSGIVTVYDSGVARTNTSASSGISTYFDENIGAIAFGSSASTLYGMSNAAGSYLYQLTIDSTGVSAVKQIGTGTGGSTMQYDNGLLYVPEGLAYNASTGAQAGQFSLTESGYTNPVAAVGPIVSDSSLDTVWIAPLTYYISSSANEIVSYNETTYDPIATLPVASLGNTPLDLIRWGTDGLALHTASQLLVFRGAIVKDNSSTPADVSVAVSAPASATTGTALSYTVTVTNSGPNSATGVTANITLPEGVIAGVATASAGSCSGAGIYYCDLGTIASGSSVTVSVSATPTVAGALEASATLASISYDPNTSNNQASASVTATGSEFNPAPVATQLSPALVQAGSAAFTLTIDGEGFTPSSSVLWNGTALATTYVGSGQLTVSVPSSSVAGIGYALVSVQNGTPGGGTSSVLPFTIYQLVSVPANAMAYDAYGRKLYAVLPSTSQQLTGNSIVSIDPTTGAVGTPVTVGSEPNLLSETSDGNYMYIGLSGADSLGRFNLQTQALDLTVPLPTSASSEPSGVAAEAIATVPGSDTSLAVELESFYGIGVLDISGSTSAFRKNVSSGYSGDFPVFADATHFYAYDGYTSGAEFYRYTIDANGVTLVDGTTLNGMGGFSGKIALDDDVVFGAGGGLVNPSTTPPSQLGLLPVGTQMPYSNYVYAGSIVPYQVENKAFAAVVSGSTEFGMYLQRFDTQHYTLDTQVQVPFSGEVAVPGTRWGQDGLAYILPSEDSSGNPTSQILLLRGPFVLPAEAVATSAPTLSSVSASTITAGSGNQTLTVTGSGFLPGATVTWGGSARTTTWVSATEVTVAIPASDVAKSATVTLGSVNPGSSASNTLTVTVQ
ncbi:MAG: IPT/TIG domain-containing protein [Silvibacterium sp.]